MARELYRELCAKGYVAHVLDGDELRRGLCSDLGMSDADREENIRRAGEVARLMFDAGINVICAFVSPFAAHRSRVRELFPEGRFVEVHLSTPLEECIRRDPKGLYARASKGEISGITGWDAPYEPPSCPEWRFDTCRHTPDQMAESLITSFHEPCVEFAAA